MNDVLKYKSGMVFWVRDYREESENITENTDADSNGNGGKNPIYPVVSSEERQGLMPNQTRATVTRIEPADSEIRKTRPWCIIQNESDCNGYNTVLTMVPVTSTVTPDNISRHSHVLFKNGKREQIIECDQVRAISIKYIKDYMYTISDETIDKVKAALAYHFGIVSVENELTLMSITSSLSKILDDAVTESRKNNNRQLISSVLDGFKSLLDEKLGSIQNEKVKVIEPVPDLEKESPPVVDPKKGSPPVVEKSVGPKQETWTVEKAEQFVSDYQILSHNEMFIKYHIADLKALYSRNYYCKKVIKNGKVK